MNNNLMKKQRKRKALTLSLKPLKAVKIMAMVKRIKTHTERLSLSRDDEMMMLIRMKNPPLDQTGGQRDPEKARNQSQQALQRKLQPGALALAMVEDVIVGVVIGRGATEVGVCTSIRDVVSKIDFMPTSSIGFNMLVTNCDDTDELSC
nr:hypothetical protein [Tanacetum cinerariifolium]